MQRNRKVPLIVKEIKKSIETQSWHDSDVRCIRQNVKAVIVNMLKKWKENKLEQLKKNTAMKSKHIENFSKANDKQHPNRGQRPKVHENWKKKASVDGHKERPRT